jgi:ubiquinone/menaquinone biosynthesis C-methylase UbiE
MVSDETHPTRATIVSHYGRYAEGHRFDDALGQLEFTRTCEILERHLPDDGLVIDIGGGPGAYARWLIEGGYTVRLLDLVPRHVEEARAGFAEMGPPGESAEATVGTALDLPYEDAVADAVLLLGPLYHLTERADRIRALCEARRTMKPGAPLFVAGISRFASLLDGLDRRFLWDPTFRDIVREDLASGRHRNPTDRPEYFTDAFFHHPDELTGEVREAGFDDVRGLAVEGPLWADRELDSDWSDEARRALLLDYARQVEGEASILGVSPHLLAVASRP